MADVIDFSKAYKVAFASTDGENVNIHYGRADRFFVYVINDEQGYDFVEERKVQPVCMGGSHLVQQMETSTEQFTDCRYVVASRIGSGASAALTAKGITGMELPGSVEEAVLKIWRYNQIQGLFN